MKITLAQLRESFREIDWDIPVENLDDTAPLREQGLDSLDMITMLSFLEERFPIKIPDSDAAGLVSLKDIAEYLNSR